MHAEGELTVLRETERGMNVSGLRGQYIYVAQIHLVYFLALLCVFEPNASLK